MATRKKSKNLAAIESQPDSYLALPAVTASVVELKQKLDSIKNFRDLAEMLVRIYSAEAVIIAVIPPATMSGTGIESRRPGRVTPVVVARSGLPSQAREASEISMSIYLEGRSTIVYRICLACPPTMMQKQLSERLRPPLMAAAGAILDRERCDLMRRAMSELWGYQGQDTLVIDSTLGVLCAQPEARKAIRIFFGCDPTGGLPRVVERWLRSLSSELWSGQAGGTSEHLRQWTASIGTLRIVARAMVAVTGYCGVVLRVALERGEGAFAVLESLGLTQQQLDVLELLPLGFDRSQVALALELGTDEISEVFKSLQAVFDVIDDVELLFRAFECRSALKKQSRP